MAIVNKYGDGYPVPGGVVSVDAVNAEASVRSIYSKVTIAATDSAASKLYFGRVPSNARILPQSTLTYEAITGLTNLDVGFANAVAALLAAKDVSSAGSTALMGAVATGTVGRRAWQLAGLTADPGGMLDIIGTMNSASTAANKAIEAQILYAK